MSAASELTLQTLVKDWTFQAQKMRAEATILLEKAALLETKYVELDIALSKLTGKSA